ncbi:hypothetical protein KW805_04700 [Candidatus Pacearchaeota archaeon]|nr:hypothetical protein [Candidatus Pacearchaeota archaeon]
MRFRFLIVIIILVLLFQLSSVASNENNLLEPQYRNYHELFNKNGIKNTLTIVGSLYEQGNLTSDECHFILHELGDYASKKIGIKKSLQEATETCRAGFIHGLFLNSNLTEVHDTSLCTGFFTKKLRLQCLHGLGHGLTVFFDYNLSEALGVCKSGKNDGYQSACASGVFMEEFSPRAHLSRNATNETFEICENNDFKSECNWYIGIRITQYNKSLTQGLKECNNAGQNYHTDCERGIGVLAARRTNYDKENVFSICGISKECLFGAASEFSLSEGIKRGLLFCRQFPIEDKRRCLSEVMFLF